MSIQGLRLLTAVSGLLAVVVGATLAVKAPSLLAEFVGDGYYIGPVTQLPIVPALIVVVGVLTFASALRGHRFLSPLTSVCLGLLTTSMTFTILTASTSWRIDEFGYPLGWLVWFIGLPGMKPHIMGVLALPFLIDLAFWTLIVGVIIFAVRRVWSDFSGRRRMERR